MVQPGLSAGRLGHAQLHARGQRADGGVSFRSLRVRAKSLNQLTGHIGLTIRNANLGQGPRSSLHEPLESMNARFDSLPRLFSGGPSIDQTDSERTDAAMSELARTWTCF